MLFVHRFVAAPLFLLCPAILLVAGCGTAGSPATGCAVTAFAPDSTTAGARFKASFAPGVLNIYPGQTETVDVQVASTGAATDTEAVTVSLVSLPPGLSSTPVVVSPGSIAHVPIKASLDVASSCFTGAEYVYSAELLLTAEATAASGTSTTRATLNLNLDNPDFAPTKLNLPVVRISTDNAAPVDSEDDYVTGTMTITDSKTSSNNYTGTMSIKGHGNSTWVMPKKPYRVKLDSKSKLLGMKSSKNWILLANYTDKSLIRTDVAFHVSEVFGMAWTPSTAYAEVYLNGEYEGLYQLAEKVEVGSNRLDIGEMDDTSISGDALTGGYLGEIDTYQGATFNFSSPSGLPISLDDPDPPTIEQERYFTAKFSAAEDALFASNFADAEAGWRASWDQASLVNWFLTNEFMGNEDADFWSSDYFYKPNGDARFYMGPVWDFDVSAGNVNYTTIGDPGVPWVSARASWFTRLLTDPQFMAAVKEQWAAKRSEIGDVSSYIDTRAEALEQGAANNYGRWPMLSQKVWPNMVAKGTYVGEVEYLKQWLAARTAYMDAHYAK